MYDYFIKEKSRNMWIKNAVLDGILYKGPEAEYYSNCNVDEIGLIPGVTGYHVNIRSTEPLEFKALTTISAPNTPSRVWL